eukprot:TRINITY_DN60817_c0_g1_i1.p1 TRINITY_DN60817_c0_g1~~TRINITY_DN60817_c0_g1_i1.p1  ORF type:complete len:394 (-),score=104.36 TRINITY_DN60817_c0_g1_i1:229-1410(-)
MPAFAAPQEEEDFHVRQQLLNEDGGSFLDNDNLERGEVSRAIERRRDSDEEDAFKPQRLSASRQVQLVGGALLAVIAVVICASIAHSFTSAGPHERQSSKHKTIKKMGLSDGISMMDGFVKAMSKSSEVMADAQEALKDGQSEMSGLQDSAMKAAGDDQPDNLNTTEQAILAAKELQEETLVEKDLTPNENTTDGNPCYDDEELFEKMCYKTCKQLTAGLYPLRTAPNSCCMGKVLADCDVAHTQTTDTPCGGLEVSGDQEGKSGCPNPPGICYSNEEAFEGTCYKKCEYLTKGIYPFRSGPESCCKIDPSKNGLACFLGALNKDADTKPEYGIGGGVGDGRDSTHSMPHSPSMGLAEVTEAPSVADVAPPPLELALNKAALPASLPPPPPVR